MHPFNEDDVDDAADGFRDTKRKAVGEFARGSGSGHRGSTTGKQVAVSQTFHSRAQASKQLSAAHSPSPTCSPLLQASIVARCDNFGLERRACISTSGRAGDDCLLD